MSTQVRPGYKLTEVGVIPVDWELSELSDVSTTSSGTTPARSLADRYYRNGTIHWVKTLDLNNSKIADTDELVTQAALEETCLKVYPEGTVLVAMYGGFNQIGRTGLLQIPAAVNQAITAVQTKSALAPEYLLATLNYKVGYWKSVASSSRKDPNITSQDVKFFKLAFPPVKEQRAIAAALTDMDAMISGLDQLIAKKRDIKQAAMQQLLTGQQRLLGFSGEWEVKQLGELAKIISGGTPRTSNPAYWGGEVKWCTPTDITRFSGKYLSETERSISKEGLADCSGQLLPIGSLLLCSRATIGELKISAAEMCTNQGFKSLICNRGVSIEFLYYKLLTMKAQMVERAIGSTFLEISKKDTFGLEVYLPGSEEQAAIATILSDMDSELATLETRRDKAHQLKLGMMQELLTGKIRIS